MVWERLATLGNNAYVVADPETIDKTWSISMLKGVIGPCAIMDIIGLQTMFNIAKHAEKNGDVAMTDRAKYIENEMLNQGKLGRKRQGYMTSLHTLLYRQVAKVLMNNKFLSFWLLISWTTKKTTKLN